MNKIRWIGLLLLVLGIGARLVWDIKDYTWIFAFLVGMGFVMLITGRFRKS